MLNMSSSLVTKPLSVSWKACQPLIVMGVSLMFMSWEIARIRVECPLWLWLYSAKLETRDMPIIVALEGILACTSLVQDHRVFWGFQGQVEERQTDIQSRSKGMTAWLRWG